MTKSVVKAKCERDRKKRIATAITDLSALIPTEYNISKNTVDILAGAVKFVANLKSQLNGVVNGDDIQGDEVRKLQKTVESLQDRCGHYAKLLDSIGLTIDVDEKLLSQSGLVKPIANQPEITIVSCPQVLMANYSNCPIQTPAGALILAPNFAPRPKLRPIVPKLPKFTETVSLTPVELSHICTQTDFHTDNYSQTEEPLKIHKETETHRQSAYFHLDEVVELVARGDMEIPAEFNDVSVLKYGQIDNLPQPSEVENVPEPIDKGGKTAVVQPTFDFTSMFEPPYSLPPLEHFLSNCNTNDTPTSWNFSLKTSTPTATNNSVGKSAEISYIQPTQVVLPSETTVKPHNFSVDFLQNGVVNHSDQSYSQTPTVANRPDSYQQSTVAKNPTWSVNKLLAKDQKSQKSAVTAAKPTANLRAKRNSLTSPKQPETVRLAKDPEVNLSNSIFDYNPGKSRSKSSRNLPKTAPTANTTTLTTDYQIANWLPVSSTSYATSSNYSANLSYSSTSYQQQLPPVSDSFDPFLGQPSGSKKVKTADNLASKPSYHSQDLPSATYNFTEPYGSDNFNFYSNPIGSTTQQTATQQATLPRTVRQPNSFQISSMLSDIGTNSTAMGVEDVTKAKSFGYPSGPFTDAQITTNQQRFEAFMTGYSTDSWQYQPYSYWPPVSTSNNP